MKEEIKKYRNIVKKIMEEMTKKPSKSELHQLAMALDNFDQITDWNGPKYVIYKKGVIYLQKNL